MKNKLILLAAAASLLDGCVSTEGQATEQDAERIMKMEGNRIKLEDSVQIDVQLNELYAWMLELDKNFVLWHPNHEYFEKLTGGFEPGDQIRFKELVMGVPYDIIGTILEHQHDDDEFYLMFETFSGMGQITFCGQATKTGCTFTHIEEFGKPATFFGGIYNWFAFQVVAKKKADWRLILNDMQEDNVNLKQILETGVYPEREEI